MDQSACSALMHALSSFQPTDAVILPNLRHLRLEQVVPDLGLTLVLAPSIRHLELRHADTYFLENSMLVTHGKLPVLRSLHVTGSFADTLSFLHVSCWSQLRVFRSYGSSLDSETLNTLSQMESLQELHLDVTDDLTHHTEHGGFLHLRILSASGDPADVAQVLAWFQQSPHLHTLRLIDIELQPGETCPRLVEALSDLQHIEYFSLDSNCEGDPDFLDFPSFWRGLKTCRISVECYCGEHEPIVPLELLLQYARQCPYLEVLSLPPIDFQPILPPRAPAKTVTEVLSMSLRELNIVNMDYGEFWDWKKALPTFIERSFPTLDLERMARSADKRVKKPWPPHDEKWLRWATVVERVRALRDTQTAQG
ncbi:hypothetical protein EVJ58_g6505 [Rhodofomes roseus]|uniref:Uncharacterized protein n=1 Tax=Rhodofomes roseus TaxID=34475 RepID=A0A4Y9Y715_9APHY|nr:hypothetical protein EVJ58_g6505 [Rhodofomes roseus]